MPVLWINFAGLIAAVVGIAALIHNRFAVEPSFSFLCSVSAVVVGLYLFGLAGLLPVGYYLVCALTVGSWAGTVVCLIKKKGVAKFFISPAFLCFVVLSLLFAVLYQNLVCFVADEYSHWALVAKETLRLDALPDYRSIVYYRDYPPATALFLYFGLRATGFSDGFAHVFQAMAAVAALCTLFAGTGLRKPVQCLIRLSVVLIVSSTITIAYTTLLVDYIVGFWGMALFVMVLFYGSRAVPPSLTQLAAVAMVASGLILVKTSAVLLVADAVAFLLILYLAQRKQWKRGGPIKARRLAVTLPVPFILFAAWLLRVELAYPGEGYASNKFALTYENIATQYASKTPEMMGRMRQEFLDTLLNSPLTRFFLLALGLAVITLILVCVVKKSLYRPLFMAVLACLGLWVVYNAGYYLLLRFLMPGWEMREGQSTILSFDRYEGSLIAVVTGTLLFAVVLCWQELAPFSTRWKNGVAAIACVLPFAGMLQFSNLFPPFPYNAEEYSQYAQIDAVYQKIPKIITPDVRLVFYTGGYFDNTSYFNNHIFSGKYQTNHTANFGNHSVDGLPLLENAEIVPVIQGSDYLVVAVEDAQLFQMLDEAAIGYDATDGIFYEVVDEGARCHLIKVQ